MTKTEMLTLLEDVRDHIISYNGEQTDDVKDSLFKVSFLKTLVRTEEIADLTQLISYVLYVGPVTFQKDGH